MTLRGTASRLSFVTAYTKDGASVDWRSFADPEATLAVYMGKGEIAPGSTAMRCDLRAGCAMAPIGSVLTVGAPF